MNKTKCAATVVICSCIMAASGIAGDLDQMLTQLDRLEARVEAMDYSSKATAQERAEDDLRQKIAQLQLEARMLTPLRERENIDQERLAALVTEISALKAEIQAMKNADNEPVLYASTDPDTYSIAMAASVTEPAENPISGIEWSGFFDVIGGIQTSNDDETDFGLGQAEVDLASQLADNIAVEAAIAYAPDDGLFELGAALIDIDLFGSEGGHTRPSFGIDHSFIVVGMFDIPFGIDYQVIPSPDRLLVTTPAVVNMTHDSWNDIGLQFGIEATHGNFVFYMVDGFEASAEVIDVAQTLATGTDVYEEVDTSPANAIGTRLGIAPFSWLEIGSSLATGWNAAGRSEMTLVGADLQFAMAGFELKGEFIAHSVNRSIAEENNRGYYAQATYHILDRAFVTTRFGSVRPEGAEWINQSSIGVGYSLNEAVGIRVETVLNENNENNQTIFQMVASF